MISDEEIRMALGVCQKATEGPWTIEPGIAHLVMIDSPIGTIAHGIWPQDAAFIKLASDLLPLALQEIMRLRGT